MYSPEIFTEEDRAVALKIMRENPLANVITFGSELIANPIPTVVDASGGAISIRFHLALRNPQCESLTEGSKCLLTFTGPNCYVSPSWYTEHPNVPTWNYVCVHAHGTIRPLREPELEELLLDLSQHHERAVGGDWRYEELPDAFRRELLAEIRGFRVDVDRLEAKSKLSQNRIPTDRARVAKRLLSSESPNARAVGTWMVERFPDLVD